MMEQARTPDVNKPADPLTQMARRGQAQAVQQQSALRTALSQAFARMCTACPGLDGAVTALARRQVSLAELVELTEPGMFLGLLQGPDERIGMIWLCPAGLAAVVEAQTTGQVLALAEGRATPRMPTRTDAALLAPLIDSFLHQVSTRCAGLPEAGIVSGFVYGSFLEDRRPMGVVLEDEDYDLIELRVALAQGMAAATWTLVFPRPKPVQTASEKDEAREWDARLSDTVARSAVSLNAVLCRLKLTLNEALALREGDVLRLPESTFESLGLVARGGAQVAAGRLGQAKGFRAVRLIADPDAPQQEDRHPVQTLRFSKLAQHPPTEAPLASAQGRLTGPDDAAALATSYGSER